MGLVGRQLVRASMSWEEFLALPDDVVAEWVDGEVVMSPPASNAHGEIVTRIGSLLLGALPQLRIVTESGVWLPRNRLRGPDVFVLERAPEETWTRQTPLLVVEVLSPSTRTEDLVRKAQEYLEAGIGQYWVVDADDGADNLVVFANVDGSWDLLLRLDHDHQTGEVTVGEHGVVPLDLARILPS